MKYDAFYRISFNFQLQTTKKICTYQKKAVPLRAYFAKIIGY